VDILLTSSMAGEIKEAAWDKENKPRSRKISPTVKIGVATR